jgi:hypothetical protein
MSVKTWQPAAQPLLSISLLEQLLLRLPQDLTDINSQVELAGVKDVAWLMKSGGESWKLAEALSDSDIRLLVVFFTLAEKQLSGWEAGRLSPVIDLVRILKERGSFQPELRKWIKANTDNRYLPNGPVL